MMLKYLIQTSIFRYSKNYGSLTHETRIKDAVNMGDLICLLATVRTLNSNVSRDLRMIKSLDARLDKLSSRLKRKKKKKKKK